MGECEKECVFNSNNECWLACKNKFYNQALEDFIEKIGNYTIVCNDGVTEIVEMKEIMRCKEQLIK